MTGDSANVGRWRAGGAGKGPERTGPTASTKWIGAAAVSTLLLVAVAFAGWLTYQLGFATGPRPYFVGLWVGPYDRPEIPPSPWRDADRRALADDRVFPNVDARPEAAVKPTLLVLQRRLKDLAARPSGEDLVVYLSAFAIVDDEGKVRILAADSVPYEPKTQLPLSEVFQRLQECPSRNKLLVLDIARAMTDPRDVGATADGVAGVLARETTADPSLTVIAACGPGQSALGSESMGHSTFGHFFHRALTTEEADADRNGAVSVRELADYLGRNVDAWALHFRGRHQTPMRLGGDRVDFALAATRPTPPIVAGARKAVEPPPGSKTKDAPAVAEEKKEEPEDAYPAWLAAAWETIGRWDQSGAIEAAPRVYRRLAAEAIRADLRWRGGEPIVDVRSDLKQTLDELTEAMTEAEDVPRPRVVRSVGQARAFGMRADPALKGALVRLFGLFREQPDDSPKRQGEIKKGLEAFKGKGGLDFALALADASAETDLDAKALAFLDGLVRESAAVLDPDRPPLDVIELRFLDQLAERSRRDKAWRPETARLAWRTALQAEEACSRPESFARVRALLDRADAERHEARVLLLPQAAGFAPWLQVAAAWDLASKDYQLVIQRQRAIRQARAALARSMETLVGLLPYLEVDPDAGLHDAWIEAAGRCAALARKLEPPGGSGPEPPGIVAELSDLAGQLDAFRRDRLLGPFRESAIRAMVAACRDESPADPSRAVRIEAMLRTPFLAAADRARLIDAARTLDDRLGKSWQPGASTAPTGEVREARPGVLARRYDRMTALLDLAGDAAMARRLGQDRGALDRESDRPALACAAVARCAGRCREAMTRLLRSGVPGDELDRPGWLAPAHVADFSNWTSGPGLVRRLRDADARAAWTWLAARYRFESRDLHDLADPGNVLADAANECPADPAAAPEVPLRIDVPASPVALSSRKPSAPVVLNLALIGAEASQKVAVDVVPPGDPRLEVALPELGSPDVGPNPTPVTLGLKLTDDATAAAGPPSAGLVVRAQPRDGGRTYHALVPLSIVTAGMVPRLALSRNAADCDDTAMDRLRLRPIKGMRQPFFVFVRNPSDRAWDVIVDILDGDRVVASSGPKPMKIEAGTSKPVPGFGRPAPKPGDELPEAPAALALRLTDAAGSELDRQPLRVGIAEPSDYVEVRRAEFVPAGPGQPNRLTVVLRPIRPLAGPPCPVELVLPAGDELFPSLREAPASGRLAGALTTDRDGLTLYAEDVGLAPMADDEGAFYLNIDGVRRALWFRGRFPMVGGPQQAREFRPRRVRFTARPRIDSDRPGPIQLEIHSVVDGARPDATIEFRLGQVLSDGRFVDDFAWGPEPARRRHLGFDPGGEHGALLFEASIEDQGWTKVPGVLGHRLLVARLLDGGRDAPRFEQELTLDNRRPASSTLVLPPRVKLGTREVPVEATVAPTISGIREVALVLGRASDFAEAEKANKLVLARPGDPDGRSWSARLPIPADAPPALVVTARFTTGAGLTAFRSAEVAVDRPKPEDEKPAGPKPGSISGKVREGDRPQPRLVVQLYDPNPPPNTKPLLESRITDAAGAFSFEGLKPKEYLVYCLKQDGINNRTASKRVTLEPGGASKLDLELSK